MPSRTKAVLGVMHEAADFLFFTSARNKWDERVYRRTRRQLVEGVELGLARKGCLYMKRRRETVGLGM